MDSAARHERQRYRSTIIGSIIIIGVIATLGGAAAIYRIDRHLDERSVFDSSLFLSQTQQMQFHLTQAVEEAFAYLVSDNANEKQEFLEWANNYSTEIARLRRAGGQPHPSPQSVALLDRIEIDKQNLVKSAQELFTAYEQNGGVDKESFNGFEAVVDRIIIDTQELVTITQREVELDHTRLLDTLTSAKNILLWTTLLAALFAALVTFFMLRVLARERKARDNAEAIMRVSEQNFLDHYNRAPDMHLSVDATSMKIVECNQTTIDELGYGRDQLLESPVLDFYASGSREMARQCLQSLAETGRAAADHLQVVAANGELIDVSLRVAAVRDEQGNIIRSRSVWRDIRNQVAIEKALQTGEARFRSLVTNAPVCIHEVDRDGLLIDMNASGLAMVGETDPESIKGIPYLDFVQSLDRERIGALIERALNGETVEYEFKSDSTPVKEFQSSFVPIFDGQGRVDRLMGVTQDLTSRRASERALLQKQKMEALGRLAGGIAHDFNNLLTVVIGYCEELRRLLRVGTRESQYIEQVTSAASQAAMLTAQLLAFSRHEERTPQVLDLNKIVGELEDLLSRVIGEDITLLTQLDESIGWVAADPGQIQQILVNLAANSRDAMTSGGTLRIATRAVDNGRKVQLNVHDTGHGIDPDVREHIFEPFYTTKDAAHGSGLGLATVLGIVEQNNGEIRVDSEIDRGTRITIEFPCAVSTDRAPSTGATESPGKSLRGKETILFAEDQEPVRKMMCRALSTAGYTVLEANDGHEALTIARGHESNIDILITDLVMPVMGGTELADELRKILPSIKVIFISGFTANPAPADTVLVSKPFTPSELIRTMRKVLDEA